MDFDRLNKLADRIRAGENGKLYGQLIEMCIPYLLRVKSRFGFHRISCGDVVEELTADAIADAITILEDRKLPFAVCLQNTFRNCCRRKYSSIRRPAAEELAERCELSCVPGMSRPRPHGDRPDVQAEQNELIELIRRELPKHGPASKTAIYERMRGAPFKEIASIIGDNDASKLFWDDFDRIRGTLRSRYMKDEDN